MVKCFRLRSGAATFSQALCEALGSGLLGGFGCGAVSGRNTQIPPLPSLDFNTSLHALFGQQTNGQSRRVVPPCSSCNNTLGLALGKTKGYKVLLKSPATTLLNVFYYL